MSKIVYCSAPPSASAAEKSACIEDRVDIVFFAGTSFDFLNSPDTKAYFEEAKKFFQSRPTPAYMPDVQPNLSAIIDTLNNDNKRGKFPWGDIHIVSHAAKTSWFMRRKASSADTFSRSLKLLDLLHATRSPLWLLPDLKAAAIDSRTRIILNACMVAESPDMLSAIADIFAPPVQLEPSPTTPRFPATHTVRFGGLGRVPEVRGPRHWLFFRTDQAGVHYQRFFRDVGTACTPPGSGPPFSDAVRATIVEQLAKQHPADSESDLDAVVKRVTAPWTSATLQSEWIETGPVTVSLSMTILVDEGGNLSFQSPRSTDKDGYPMPPTIIPIDGVKDADMPTRVDEVVKQVLFQRMRRMAYGDPKFWQVSTPVVNTVAAVAGTAMKAAVPKRHEVSTKLDAQTVVYYLMVNDGEGKPVIPDVEDKLHYAMSNWSSRTMDKYYSNERYLPATIEPLESEVERSDRLGSP